MQTEFQRHQDGEFKVEQLLAVDAESVFDFLLGAEDEWASAFHDRVRDDGQRGSSDAAAAVPMMVMDGCVDENHKRIMRNECKADTKEAATTLPRLMFSACRL